MRDGQVKLIGTHSKIDLKTISGEILVFCSLFLLVKQTMLNSCILKKYNENFAF